MKCVLHIPDYDSQTSLDVEDDTNNIMKTDTQTSTHHRMNGKMTAANSSSTTVTTNSTIAQQKKDAEYKRLTENTMQVCNVNLMETSLASR